MDFKLEDGLVESGYWLVKLRWVAIAGVILTVLFVDSVIGVTLPVFAISALALFLALYNCIFTVFLYQFSRAFIRLQISLDLFSLAVLLHLSGGIENPFIFYFIFHMIIVSTLLTLRESYLEATFTVLLFLGITGLEYSGLLSHYPLKGFGTEGLYLNKIYITGVSFVFISTLYIAVYMATSIAAKLRQREKSLQEANLLLEEKDRIKSEYVLSLSRDIKEHLSSIETCLEPLTQGTTGQFGDDQRDLIRRASAKTGKLAFFVNALLEVTRLKLSPEIERGYFSLKRAIENAIKSIEAKSAGKNIGVSVVIEPGIEMARGAQIYIEEAIGNLLANSVQYTPANGKINIEVKDMGASILLSVSDTGIGIPADELPKVFDEFYRARNARDVIREAAGLGLSIAKQIVERHSGKIWAESKENGGSTFYIELPK